MNKTELKETLINEYDMKPRELEEKTKPELEQILEKMRSGKGFIQTENFWKIKGLPTPKIKYEDGKEGTEKYAWLIFAAWIGMFFVFGLCIFLLVFFLGK